MREKGGVTLVDVAVRPRATIDAILEVNEVGVKVSVKAAPRAGRANRAVAETVARRLGVSKSRVRVVKGRRGARKVVSIEGLSAGEVRKRLTEIDAQ